MQPMKKKKAAKPAKAKVRRTAPATVSFPIAGIGASAGGLEAVTQLLKSLPATTGMGFVLVQHLDPQHESALAALLSRTTEMPVIEARDGMRVEKDHFYVIPPNKKMGISNRTLQLLPRGNGDGQWNIHALRKLLQKILPAKSTFKDFRVEHDFPRIGRKTMLLNARRLDTPRKGTQSILLAMEDVSGRG